MKKLSRKKAGKYYFPLICCFLLFSIVLLASCKYDDSELTGRVDNIENRLTMLEKQCKQINVDIHSLKVLIAALDNPNYITAVSDFMENGKKAGYKIEFSDGESIILYHGKDGTDGTDGTDSYVPAISTEKDKDGIYYWTIDGEWMTDKDGKKIKAVGTDGKNGNNGSHGTDGVDGTDGRDGITPQIRINDKRWEVSYDNGNNWTDLGPATAGVAPSPITDVQVKKQYAIFTLSTGERIQLALYDQLSITFETNQVELEAGGTLDLSYKLSRTENVKVSVIGEGLRTKVNEEQMNITLTADENFENGKVWVHATDGNIVAITELDVTKLVITYIEYEANERIDLNEAECFNPEAQFLKEKSSFDSTTKKGKWAYKGDLRYVRDFAFACNKVPVTSITFPACITDLGKHPFKESNPGGSVFENSKTITSVTIEGDVKKIRLLTFKECSNLKKVDLPDGLERIDYQAFLHCSSLEKIELPDNVKVIGKSAFNGCTSLKTIICRGTTPAQLDGEVFMKDKYDGWTGTTTQYIKEILVPQSAVSAYQQADGWKDFANRIKAIEGNN